MKLALVFSGQGSQFPNMGLDFLNHHDLSSFEKIANQILRYDIRSVLENQNDVQKQTLYAQPAILFHSIIAYETFKKMGIKPDGLLGFSLGEFAAYYASNIFSFEDVMKMITYRANVMHACTLKHKGKMAAVLYADRNLILDTCKEVSVNGYVGIANYNSKTQYVISGYEDQVNEVVMRLKSKGVRRIIELHVSGAFHSPLMKEAGEKMFKFLDDLKTNPPSYPIYLNRTSLPLEYAHLKLEIKKQIESPVLFEQSIIQMIRDGFTHFLEIGPGRVLTGLIKKIDEDVEVFNLETDQDLKLLEGWIPHEFKR